MHWSDLLKKEATLTLTRRKGTVCEDAPPGQLANIIFYFPSFQIANKYLMLNRAGFENFEESLKIFFLCFILTTRYFCLPFVKWLYSVQITETSFIHIITLITSFGCVDFYPIQELSYYFKLSNNYHQQHQHQC